jgi:membrane fusion protein (multidrug efflux system)
LRRHKGIWIFTVLCLLIAIIIFCWWFFSGRFFDQTEDAYVNGNQICLTSQISGIVTHVNVDDTFFVEEGQILVKLDETDCQIALGEAKAALGEVIRKVTQMFENVYALGAEYEMRQAQMLNKEIDYADRKAVVALGAVSEEEYIQSEAEYFIARAALEQIKYKLMQAISEVQNTSVSTHPAVEKAKENLRKVWVDLERCTLRAPATGIVALRQVQVGQSIYPTTPLLAIIPIDQMWVDANFKEVDLANIRIGQEASVTADTYGREVLYNGKVIGIGGGSGAVFSPLPPQNATGNWIKIVQRIPVRISLNSNQLRKYPLRLGLSMKVSIDIRDREGLRIPGVQKSNSLYETDIFKKQVDGSEAVIEEVIQQNSSFDFNIAQEISRLVR